MDFSKFRKITFFLGFLVRMPSPRVQGKSLLALTPLVVGVHESSTV